MHLNKAFLPLSFLIISIIFASCEGKESKEYVSVNNDYEMALPKYLTKTSELNSDASLQYQNTLKEAYIIVIDDNKQEFVEAFKALGMYDSTKSILENYRETQMGNFHKTVKVNNESTIRPLTINGLNAQMLEIDAKVEGIEPEVSYFFGFIEGKKNLYMVMPYTSKKKKERLRGDFEEAIKSFRLLETTDAEAELTDASPDSLSLEEVIEDTVAEEMMEESFSEEEETAVQ